jgi:hypothetical protein
MTRATLNQSHREVATHVKSETHSCRSSSPTRSLLVVAATAGNAARLVAEASRSTGPGACQDFGDALSTCFAMTKSLILAYVAEGTIFLVTKSSFRVYGRPLMIFCA